MSFVVADLGASSTRFASNTGTVSIIPNNMVFLDKDKRVDLVPHDDQLESSLDVIIEKQGESKYFPVRALVGQMAERYTSNNVKPSVMSNKHEQKINYVSAVLAVALSKIKCGFNDNVSLYLALPPIEVRSAKDIVASNLVGRYKVTLPKYNGGVTLDFEITDTSCHEESFMALVSYFFDVRGAMKEEHKKYLTGHILSLDIGASTTDLAIVKDGKYLDKTGQTYKTGGNIARDYLIDQIRAMHGFDLPIADAEITMAEGRLQLGDSYEDASALVSEAKEELARSIVGQIQGYFRQVNIPIQTIRAIVVSGGGSMKSAYVNAEGEIVETSKAVGHYITEPLKDICSGVKIESYGDNPRLAVVTGLLIRAQLDVIKKAKMAMANKENK